MVKIECVGGIALCPHSEENDFNYQYSLSITGYNPETDYIDIETPLPHFKMWSNSSRLSIYTKHQITKLKYKFSSDSGSGEVCMELKSI